MSTAARRQCSHWEYLASAYPLLGSPLRPSPEDIAIAEAAVEAYVATRSAYSSLAVLMGATPDLARMRWPASTKLIGSDASHAMMRFVWPGDEATMRFGICANWLAFPLPPSSVQIVVGDGSLNCVRHPEEADALCASVRDVLVEDGLMVLRCFVRPHQPESVDGVFSEMYRGAIPTYSQFKFRLFVAMEQDLRRGLAVAELYRLWASYSIDPVCLAKATGWPLSEIQTMDGFRDSSTVHTFPTMTEFRGLLERHFDLVDIRTPSYPLGEQCPTFVVRNSRRDRS